MTAPPLPPAPGAFPYRLAAIDLDDTLLGPDKRISAANREAVRTLRGLGLRIVLASGRRHENMLRFHRELDLDGPIVSCNGALVKNAETGDVLGEQRVPADLAAAVIAEGTGRGITQNYYHVDGGLFVRERTPWTDLYRSRTGSDVDVFGDLTGLAGDRPLKIIWIEAPDVIARLLPEMEARFAGQLYITTTDPEYLEFMALGVNKAVGVEAAAARGGIPREQVLALGDGNNYVPLLRWAGLGVAMHNARPGAKEAADLVAPPGDPETGFARAVAAVLEREAAAAPRKELR